MSTMKTSKGTELPFTDIKGKLYLDVKYRIIWFREDHPDWGIETEIKPLSAKSAMAKATIKNEEGRILSTAHKIEDEAGFHDYTEKAETGAIGRALSILGYGTANALELEEGEKIVDAPVLPKNAPKNNMPLCCGKPMMESKYNKEELYCLTCKKKKEKTK